jgi:hypothetical protein
VSIVVTEIDSIHGDVNRMIFYRCQDHLGVWHNYGPIITSDVNFDAEAFKPTAAAKVAAWLAESEAQQVIQ